MSVYSTEDARAIATHKKIQRRFVEKKQPSESSKPMNESILVWSPRWRKRKKGSVK